MFESSDFEKTFGGDESINKFEALENMLQELLDSDQANNLFKLTAMINRKTMDSLIEVGFERDEAVRITAVQGGNLLG